MYMKLNINILLAIITCCILFVACEDETFVLAESSFDYEYYPLEVGHSWTYRMDSTILSNNGNLQTQSTSFIKEEIADQFINPAGDTTFVLHLSKSSLVDGNYSLAEIYQVIKTGSRVTRYEENLGFIKMFFPITVGDTLDVNLFDHQIDINIGQDNMKPYKDWEFTVVDNRINTQVNGIQYTDVAHLQQANHENDIELRRSKELYAPHVGLIYRQMTILDTQNPVPTQTWLEQAEAGFTLTQTLVNHNL